MAMPSKERDRSMAPDVTDLPDPRLAQGTGHDLEIKDAQIIFKAVWQELLDEYGKDNLRFPKEFILLGGAPGAGKGTQTEFIRNARGLTCRSIVVSSLLDTPEERQIKNKGGMVGDRQVVRAVFKKLLEEEYRDGAVLDGFPRTKVQVECLKHLVDMMKSLHREFYESIDRNHFRRPTVHVMLLFVEEKVSIDRQLKRGREIAAHNEEVKATGIGDYQELRETDLSIELAQRRYRTFKEQTWEALQSLRKTFHYHFIDANGSIGEVEENILSELKYQSSLELNESTFTRLRGLPLANEIVVHARQDLVHRLDAYELQHPELFQKVIRLIQDRIMPIVIRHAISGVASVNSEAELLHDPTAIGILIDIFSERGYHAVVDIHRIEVPEHFDLETGKISCREKKVFRITVRFKGSEIRRG